MASIRNRRPYCITNAQLDQLTKAEWADAFCDLYLATTRDTCSSDEMVASAKEHVEFVRLASIRDAAEPEEQLTPEQLDALKPTFELHAALLRDVKRSR